MGRFRDFDEAWAQRKTEPVVCKILGKTYSFPGTLPAKVVLRITRMARERKADAPIDADQMLDLLSPIFGGREFLDELIEGGVDVDQLNDVLEWVSETYKVASSDRAPAGEDGDPPAERTADSTPSIPSSNGGVPSKPIGVESTAGT